jgi:hypothetical protein
MKFQVVLQWPASSVNDFNGMVEIEDLLVEKLGAQNEVDGHDFGAEETNIFVHTDVRTSLSSGATVRAA